MLQYTGAHDKRLGPALTGQFQVRATANLCVVLVRYKISLLKIKKIRAPLPFKTARMVLVMSQLIICKIYLCIFNVRLVTQKKNKMYKEIILLDTYLRSVTQSLTTGIN